MIWKPLPLLTVLTQHRDNLFNIHCQSSGRLLYLLLVTFRAFALVTATLLVVAFFSIATASQLGIKDLTLPLLQGTGLPKQLMT